MSLSKRLWKTILLGLLLGVRAALLVVAIPCWWIASRCQRRNEALEIHTKRLIAELIRAHVEYRARVTAREAARRR